MTQPASCLVRAAARSSSGDEMSCISNWKKSKKPLEVISVESTDLNAKNSAGLTPLALSMSEELNDVAELLLKSGASVNVTDANGNTLLHLALTG